MLAEEVNGHRETDATIPVYLTWLESTTARYDNLWLPDAFIAFTSFSMSTEVAEYDDFVDIIEISL